MQKFRITIQDQIFGELSGEFFAPTEELAIAYAKAFYAQANDTTEDKIEIVSVEKLPESK